MLNMRELVLYFAINKLINADFIRYFICFCFWFVTPSVTFSLFTLLQDFFQFDALSRLCTLHSVHSITFVQELQRLNNMSRKQWSGS